MLIKNINFQKKNKMTLPLLSVISYTAILLQRKSKQMAQQKKTL